MNGASGPPPALEPPIIEAPQPIPLPPIRPLRFQRADWWAFCITAACALTVYVFTLAPEVTLEWSGMRSTAAWYGGVADPPGFPLWTLYAWAFSHLFPFGNIAWRLALSSAVAGAFACGALAMLVSSGGGRILDGMTGVQRLPEKQEAWLRIAGGFVAGMALGLHRVFWSMSVIVETQSLSLALFSLVICLLLRWAYSPDNEGLLYAAVFVYALELNVHQNLAIAAPGLILIVLIRNPGLGRDLCFVVFVVVGCFATILLTGLSQIVPAQFDGLTMSFLVIAMMAGFISMTTAVITRKFMTHWRAVSISGLLLLAGFYLYFYLAVASMADPPSNWGYARTVQGFVHLVSRGQYEGIHPTDNIERFVGQIGVYWRSIGRDLGFIFLIPAVALFCFLRKMGAPQRAWILGLVPLFLCLSLWLIIMQNGSPDRASAELTARYYTPSHVIILLWAGYGLCILGSFLIGKWLPRILPRGQVLLG
ncbi:MAG: hypothetical protein C5B50_19795 [Verrucomicrobia bacterium]|nr:MAG: hypothetical protein C5B50_19795 [Verrucomicrobiota bacterium]